MFPSIAYSTLIALVASAVAVSAAPGLSLNIAGPETVTNVDNLKVTVTITNTGDETLKVLNDPNSPLSTLPANSFAISNANGASPKFIGVKVKYVPQTAIDAGNEATTVLAPSESVNVEHNLSEAYNFTSTGEGAYSFEARNLFYIVDSSNKAVPLHASTTAYHASISGKLSVTRPAVEKRANFNGCSRSQELALVIAAADAQLYAAGAYLYAKTHAKATPRYTTWFGTYTSSRHATVLSHYSAISKNNFLSYKFDCTNTDPGTYVIVNPDSFGIVSLGGAFWKSPATGTDSKAGILIHAASRFTVNGGTDDYEFFQEPCKALAISNPDHAIDNADSNEYFAENHPTLA